MEKLINRLLKKTEGTYLDFKRDFYKINDKKSKIDFVKDILAFANSTINEPAYILCGVQEKETGDKEVIGIDPSIRIDDASWVQFLNSYASHPINFFMKKIKSDLYNKTFVLIEISTNQQRPIFCIKDEGDKLKKGNIYFRNGSSNDIAKDLVTLEIMISKTMMQGNSNLQVSDPTYNRYSKFPPAPYYEFIGRREEIKKIYDELIDHHKNYLLSLVGDGGIGKTSIAYKVAEEIKDKIDGGVSNFDDVIWISAKDQRLYFDERRELNPEFRSLDDLFNKILLIFYDVNYIKDMNRRKKLDFVNQALEGTKFFFVLDNLEIFDGEEINQIYQFIKNAPFGHKFLLTSRHDLRVHEFVKIERFNLESSREYINNLVINLNVNEIDKDDIINNFNEFYTLTNGNPLYINFFISQILRGRKLKDILAKRNLESEKSLKAYCFDSTLSNLSGDELKVMYTLAVSEQNFLSFNELRYVTLIQESSLFNIIGSLTSHSLVYTEYQRNTKVYSLNWLLKSYLLEEKRIPVGEYTRLYQKVRTISIFSHPIKEELAFNFGLRSLINTNEIMSYNMILNVLDNVNNQNVDSTLDDIIRLYPGNYLVYFYKNLLNISNGTNLYNVYANINSDFAHILSVIKYDEERVMSYVWKSFLYILIDKYDDVINDMDMLINNSNKDHIELINIIKATCLSMKAFNEYRYNRFNLHDQLRDDADVLFSNNLRGFIGKPYFLFIKKNLIYAYKQNLLHVKKTKISIENGQFVSDILILKDLKLFTKKPVVNLK
ncbi:NB-ARC domain-containing protein [Thermicanus aegyptius]|uniref:NB-ARC domain-containing protein n=1 Tax=Thermicanus aegyptius TaxID=94009 RepID=UPI0003F9F32E|nr:RNA-binding domain-containing protein [Thermicanus aegyptius]